MDAEKRKLLNDLMDLAEHFGSLAETAFDNAHKQNRIGNHILKVRFEGRGSAFKQAGLEVMELVLENLRKTGRI